MPHVSVCVSGMFIEGRERICSEKLKSLACNNAWMDAILEAVSTYLADVLRLNDESCRPKTLVDLMHEEIHHFPNRRRLEEMKQLDAVYEFIVHAEDLADRLYKYSRNHSGNNISLENFVAETAYYLADEVIEQGVHTTRIPVGGLYRDIAREVERHTLTWLDELDRVLCKAADIDRTDAGTSSLKSVKKKLAVAISERVAIQSNDACMHDSLSSRELERMLVNEMSRTSNQAEVCLQKEMHGLQLLASLACIPESAEVKRILTEDIALMRDIVFSPPCELVATVHYKALHMQELHRALATEMDVEIRVALVTFWAHNYGDVANHAVLSALEKMKDWKQSRNTCFVGIVKDDDGKGHSLSMPTMKFLKTDRTFVSVKASPGRRSGLDEQGTRSVRIIQCVWELCSRGVFRPGIVSADVITPVAQQGIVLNRMAAAVIVKERRTNQKGVSLQRTCAWYSTCRVIVECV